MPETEPGNHHVEPTVKDTSHRLPDQGLGTFTPEELESLRKAKDSFVGFFRSPGKNKDRDNIPVRTKEKKQGCIGRCACIGILAFADCLALTTLAVIEAPKIVKVFQK